MIFVAHFGRGKPVQINPLYYKHPRRGELFVSLAGPGTNLLLAIVGIIVMLIYIRISGGTPYDAFLAQQDMMIQFWRNFSYINIALAVFNLIPIAPLDGYRLIKIWWPQ